MTLLNVGGLDLAFTDVGSGPAVLLLHPFPLDSTLFAPLIDALARERRVLAVDFPGFGQSPPPRGDVPFKAYAPALRELLARVQVAEVDGLGVSMGGYALLELSREAPQLLRRVVFAGSRATPSSPEAIAKHEVRAVRALKEGIGWLEAEWVPLLLKPGAELPAKREVGHIIRRATPAGVAAAARAIATRGDQSDAARRITAQTLLLHGGEDRVVTLADAEATQRLIPNARLEVIPGAGHVALIDEPEHFIRAVLSFFQG